MREGHQGVARARPCLAERSEGLGVAGDDDGEHSGGGWSSGADRFDAMVHDGRNWWVLRAPEVAVSTTVGSGASCGGCGHGHAMAGGEKLSAAVEKEARGCARA